MLDILHFYSLHPHSPQLEEECQRAYSHLSKSREAAAKIVVPLSLLVAVSSLRRRSFWEITRNLATMVGAGMAISEVSEWNSLSAKLYLLQRSSTD
jgi:hypothetical protein